MTLFFHLTSSIRLSSILQFVIQSMTCTSIGRYLCVLVLGGFYLTAITYGQSQDSRLLFRPLIANPFEPRIGTMYQASDNSLRLDIGNSFDLISLYTTKGILTKVIENANTDVSNQTKSSILDVDNTINEVLHKSTFTAKFGSDFFTYTRLRSEGNLKFPVETIDYLFGVNGSMLWHRPHTSDSWQRDIGVRVRISHISAHLADGLANQQGLLSPTPFVYSREFVDAIGSIELTEMDGFKRLQSVRLYGGGTFIFSNKRLTEDVNLILPQAGAEYRRLVTSWADVFGAYDVRLSGVGGATSAIHTAQVGVIFPQSNGYELMISGYWYSGLSLHGLFYNTRDSYLGFGFQILM